YVTEAVHVSLGRTETSLKLDKTGLPLIPQPSEDASDPLNFPQWLKVAILLQVSFLALLGPLNQATINPAFVPLAAHFKISTVHSRALVLLFGYPLANTYGRRPVLLFTTLIAAASSLGSGKALTWSQLIATRVLNGLGTSGRAMGIFTVFLTNSAPIAPIPGMHLVIVEGHPDASFPGGFLGQFVSYRWCYYLPAILDFTMFVTLYLRGSTPVVTDKPILRRMKLWGLRPKFIMFKYPTVLLTAFYYSSPLLWPPSCRLYTGLALGLGTLIGSTRGAPRRHRVDRSMYLSRKNKTATSLQGIWVGAILQPIGLLIWGFCIQYKSDAVHGPTMGFGIMCFAIQIISTVLYSYNADCYKPQTPEIAQVMNFGRQTRVAFIPIVVFMFHGKTIRDKMGVPSYNRSL
ncbi:MFS general substrate transporter, partial [Mycena galericulata]